MDRKRGEGSPDPEGSGAQVPGGAGENLVIERASVDRPVSLHCVWARCARAALYVAPLSIPRRPHFTSRISRVYS
ncbi:unnamed protein product [Leptosia nina]|uniref:Uncharacterized protein n=1 Tax=Leptosia nina TaxID=320188 RepID=A0AAV1JN26_9NEOP